MNSAVNITPTFSSAIIDAGRRVGADVAKRAIAPTDEAKQLIIDNFDAPTATLWQQRQNVEAERTLGRLGAHISAVGAVACGLLGLTGLAALLVNPILWPVGGAMVLVGIGGLVACGVSAERGRRSAQQAENVATKLDKNLHRAVASMVDGLKTPQRRTLTRSESQPNVVADPASAPRKLPPGYFPGDFGLMELLAD